MNNQFQRFGYSPYNYSAITGPNASQLYGDSAATRTVFTGGDIGAYINQIPVTNLESASWTIQVDVVPNYVMGRRDAVVYTTGRRQITGTLIFSQYDRHALIEQVFQLSRQGITTQGALWGSDQTLPAVNLLQNQSKIGSVISGVGGTLSATDEAAAGISTTSAAALGLRGLTASQYNSFVQQAAAQTASLIGAQNISYSDQLPPFDLTLIGVSRNGDAAKCSIFGIQITNESAGMSSSDISNAIGLSFVALGVSPWRPIESLSGTAQIPPQR